MDFEFDAKTLEVRTRLLDFMDTYVYPAEHTFHEQIRDGERWTTPPIIQELKARARDAGLWNLFLPHDPRGAGLTNLTNTPLSLGLKNPSDTFRKCSIFIVTSYVTSGNSR